MHVANFAFQPVSLWVPSHHIKQHHPYAKQHSFTSVILGYNLPFTIHQCAKAHASLHANVDHLAFQLIRDKGLLIY